MPLTAVVVAAPVVVVPWVLAEPWWCELTVVATLLIAVAAVPVDLADARIPDRIVMAAVLPVVLTLVVRVVAGDTGDIGGVLLGAAAFAGPLLIVHGVTPGAMGFGDVKLAAVLGAALGLVDWRVCLLALCLASVATACVAIVRRRASMPFAPGLVGGAAVALLPTATEGLLPWR